MAEPHYCSTGWNLYQKLAENHWNFETGEDVPPELFDVKNYDDCLSKLNEHMETCPQCSLEEARFQKKRAVPAHIESLKGA
jgi:hypothetical protein